MLERKCMTAQRYAELLSIAKGAVDTIELIYDGNEINDGSIKFDDRQLKYIIGVFCINAIEAFVNYLGYVFDDHWKLYEKANFWQQYERLMKLLKNLNISVSEIEKYPFNDFKKYREEIRNEITHVHSSKHDYQEMKVNNDGKEEFTEAIKMINSWGYLENDEAIKLYKESEGFIKNLHKRIKINFEPLDFLNHLDKSVLKLENRQLRQILLNRFLYNPLNSIPITIAPGIIKL